MEINSKMFAAGIPEREKDGCFTGSEKNKTKYMTLLHEDETHPFDFT